MNLTSSRWCVMALFAYGALACSDPVPLPAQGALNTTVSSVSPPVAGKACSAGAAFTFDVPNVRTQHPGDVLTPTNYDYHVIDGQNRASVKCTVSGGPTFHFSGALSLNGEGFEISSGTVDATNKGTATVTIKNSQHLSSSLISPTPCTIDVAIGQGNKPQVEPGHIWASFTCPSVEAPPSDSCAATGVFVLENCAQ